MEGLDEIKLDGVDVIGINLDLIGRERMRQHLHFFDI